MTEILRKTRSVCPICLKNLPAVLCSQPDGAVMLEKCCPNHGNFRVPVWRGRMDFEHWITNAAPLSEDMGTNCPENCGLCAYHGSASCCVLLEVTARCNLRCRFCFADGGQDAPDPSLENRKAAILDIARRCGNPLLQLSGGEPTLRDDLPELIRYAKEVGCRYVQLNTNGIRLAQEPEYVQKLAQAGLDIVFLQFDGTDDIIYKKLRDRPLLDVKLQTIRNCGSCRLGVTLVPTVVRGVNDQNLGSIISFAAQMVPTIRGIHFQPVSYFGRYPDTPDSTERYTLDELMADISHQAGIPAESFLPSRCDHPLCGFHANYLAEKQGLRPLTDISQVMPGCSSAAQNREYVARHWRYPADTTLHRTDLTGEMDFDAFLYRIRHSSLSISAMAFQDAMNLNIERLHRCSLHVYDRGSVKPFCANYLTPMEEVPCD